MMSTKVEKALELHGIEVWEQYAVEVYTREVQGKVIVGESFTALSTLTTREALRNFLGY